MTQAEVNFALRRMRAEILLKREVFAQMEQIRDELVSFLNETGPNTAVEALASEVQRVYMNLRQKGWRE